MAVFFMWPGGRRDLVVPLLEVKLAEDCRPCQAARDVGHVQERVAVGLSEKIEAAVVAAMSCQPSAPYEEDSLSRCESVG